MSVRPIPEALPILTPHLVVRDAAAAIAHYQQALGARETFRTLGPDGRVMMCELMIGDARVFVLDEFPEQHALSPTTLGGTPVALHLFVARVDDVFARAVAAGMTRRDPRRRLLLGRALRSGARPLRTCLGGSRAASRDLSPREIQARADAFYHRDRS